MGWTGLSFLSIFYSVYALCTCVLQIFSDVHYPDTPKPEPVFGKILSVTQTRPNLQVIRWKALISREIARKFAYPVEDDLVVVDFTQLNERVYTSALCLSGQELQFRFAVVESVSISPATQYSRGASSNEQPHCELVLNLKVSRLEFATNELLDGSEVELKVVTSLKSVRRQWSGLINLHTSVLVRDILCPRGGAYFCCQTTDRERFPHSSLVGADSIYVCMYICMQFKLYLAV